MSKFPRNPEMMKRRMARMKELRGQFLIPAICAYESATNLKAYYGSYWRAGWTLIWRYCIIMGLHDRYWSLVFWCCDWWGWTVVRPFDPLCPRWKSRHGGRCDKMNCADVYCIEKSVPRWFRWLTRWDDTYENERRNQNTAQE